MWWSQKIAQQLEAGQVTHLEVLLFLGSAIAAVFAIRWWLRLKQK